jgi:RNA methyltransferase, TrmH family
VSLSITDIRRLARSARERADRRAFVVEGPLLIDEALAAGVRLAVVLAAEGVSPDALERWVRAGVEVRDVPASAIASIATTVTPQPAIAVAAMAVPSATELVDRPGLLLLVDRVADPGNLGTILRSAEASGTGAVVLSRDCVDPHNPKVVRASAGSLFRVPVGVDADLASVLQQLRAQRRACYATAADGGVDYTDADLRNAAVILGSEAHGVDPTLRRDADAVIAIPHEGQAESLNVAMAATVLCFESQRQRRRAPQGRN